MADIKNHLENYNFDHAFLGSIVIEFDDTEKAMRHLVGEIARGNVRVFYKSDVGRSRKKRLKSKTKDLELLDSEEHGNEVIAVELT